MPMARTRGSFAVASDDLGVVGRADEKRLDLEQVIAVGQFHELVEGRAAVTLPRLVPERGSGRCRGCGRC